jgi:hypothetical protein
MPLKEKLAEAYTNWQKDRAYRSPEAICNRINEATTELFDVDLPQTILLDNDSGRRVIDQDKLGEFINQAMDSVGNGFPPSTLTSRAAIVLEETGEYLKRVVEEVNGSDTSVPIDLTSFNHGMSSNDLLVREAGLHVLMIILETKIQGDMLRLNSAGEDGLRSKVSFVMGINKAMLIPWCENMGVIENGKDWVVPVSNK